MRLITVSDIHGGKGNLFDIVEKHIDEAEYFINLGDCNNGDDFDDVKTFFGKKLHLISVCGNCDWGSSDPFTRECTLAQKKIFLCHGHTFNVKQTYLTLANEAKKQGADLALFGHTHIPYASDEHGVLLMNPGSVRNGNYGIIDIKDGIIECRHEKVKGDYI